MNTVGQDLGIGEDILSQEPPLINITNTLQQQQQQQPASSPPVAPPTTSNSNNKSPSIPGTSTFSLHPSPAASSSSGSSSSLKRKSSPEDESASVALKRQRNTLAARKYRQKRLDRISELEAALAAMTSERDDIRLQLARSEAQADALREMLNSKK
ncbi:BZIP domain-containing protein [Fusarium sp. LHS14.1]|nr:BZIP domain-containing protein [Fusarium sp. LHS14.1]